MPLFFILDNENIYLEKDTARMRYFINPPKPVVEIMEGANQVGARKSISIEYDTSKKSGVDEMRNDKP